MYLTWEKVLNKVAVSSPKEHKTKIAYSFILNWVHENDYKGACHDISVVLFLVLSEIGYDCDIVIGEIKLETGAVTDHSWITANQLIYDIAISKPNYPEHNHVPIFKGVALNGDSKITCQFGVAYEGLSLESEFVLGATIIEYCHFHPKGVDFVFKLACQALKSAGVRVSSVKLKNAYSNVKRKKSVK